MRRAAFRRAPSSQRGYVLIMLMLFIALLAIAAAAVAPSIGFEIRRDREEEMIHRGVQYSRAIRHYVKKFGRYPTRIEELEDTNNLRFLRKRYKDPITGQDFKILHLADVKLSFGPGIAGASPAAGQNAVVVAPTPGGGLTSNGDATAQGPALAAMTGPGTAGTNPTAPGTQDNPGADTSGQGTNQAGSGTPQQAQPKTDKVVFGSLNQSSSPTLGGGPIVGVASVSKEKSIREFNKKDHYNDWQFIYDPASDRGGLLNTPAQPPLQVSAPQLSGAQSAPGTGFGMTGGTMGAQPPPQNPAPQPPPQPQQQQQ